MLSATLLMLATHCMAPCVQPLEQKLFPTEKNVRLQEIRKADREKGWPFTVDSGWLSCSYVLGEPLVLFVTGDEEGIENMRVVSLSPDPLEAIFGNMAVNDLIVAKATPEERLTMFAPYYQLGRRLCDQPAGTVLDAGEL